MTTSLKLGSLSSLMKHSMLTFTALSQLVSRLSVHQSPMCQRSLLICQVHHTFVSHLNQMTKKTIASLVHCRMSALKQSVSTLQTPSLNLHQRMSLRSSDIACTLSVLKILPMQAAIHGWFSLCRLLHRCIHPQHGCALSMQPPCSTCSLPQLHHLHPCTCHRALSVLCAEGCIDSLTASSLPCISRQAALFVETGSLPSLITVAFHDTQLLASCKQLSTNIMVGPYCHLLVSSLGHLKPQSHLIPTVNQHFQPWPPVSQTLSPTCFSARLLRGAVW